MLELDSQIEITGRDQIRVLLLFGSRLCRDVQVVHPDLGWLKFLMENKKECNDPDGFDYNARCYLSLVDRLVDQEVLLLVERDEAFMAVLEFGALILLIGMFLIAWSHFWMYVGACAIASMTILIANLVAKKRYSAINRFRDRQLVMFDSRCADLVRKEWSELCHYTGRKVALETQGYPSRRLQPIPADTVALPVKQ